MICSNLSKPFPNLIDSIAVERLNYCNMESIMQILFIVVNYWLQEYICYSHRHSSQPYYYYYFFWNKINKGLLLFIRLRILWMVRHNQICLRNFPTYDSLYSSRLLLINWWTISTRHGWKYGTSTHYAGHGISFI